MQRSTFWQSCFVVGALATFILGVAGCSSNRGGNFGTQTLDSGGSNDELPILAEVSQIRSGIAKPLRIVIYDYSSLAQFPLLNLDVDFSTQMVLLAAMGPASSEHCETRIEDVWIEGGEVLVNITEIYPDADAKRTPAIASPLHAVVVRRCELPVEGFTSRIPKNIFLH
ncbi:MAG: hypothetical protein DHS20C16_26660 [Phycisphaerae bacterium]|nr:MAG: hypothetical protein DHS20C16_26660 [Phycisphaerae bacterium]